MVEAKKPKAAAAAEAAEELKAAAVKEAEAAISEQLCSAKAAEEKAATVAARAATELKAQLVPHTKQLEELKAQPVPDLEQQASKLEQQAHKLDEEVTASAGCRATKLDKPAVMMTTTEEGVPPDIARDVDSWLAAAKLDKYCASIKEYGYDSFEALCAATEDEIKEMMIDPDVNMRKPHQKLMLIAWQGLTRGS
jgi:hypothetical protein